MHRLVCYLNETQNLRIIGWIADSLTGFALDLFADADFAGDEESRNLTTGNLIYFGDSLISWTSKKQKLRDNPTAWQRFFLETGGRALGRLREHAQLQSLARGAMIHEMNSSSRGIFPK